MYINIHLYIHTYISVYICIYMYIHLALCLNSNHTQRNAGSVSEDCASHESICDQLLIV